ncbi:MAG: flagellar basal body P-ring formation chaperone FlgA [Campylobacterota bacterium]|nr:flagellar basal body P-ring formation chaperone FlgA [Campylobacterota bacterium]
MKLLISLLLLSFFNLHANIELKKNYFINTKTVKLSDITNINSQNTIIFTIPKERHSKRVKSRELVSILKKLGYNDISTKHNYIQFTQRSPINTSLIALKIKEYYSEKYKDITILSIYVHPRSFMHSLPKKYQVVISKKSYLKAKKTLYIKTPDNKKIFFNYTIEARINVLIAKENIQKDEELSITNLKKNSIILDKFRAMPLQKINKATIQAKHRIKQGSVVTLRDTVNLTLVKRGSKVNVTVVESGISISFLAKANQNGRYGQSISITNSNGKKLKAVVTGRNTAEIR